MPDMKREKTPAQALSALMRLCSRSEKCIGDARRLMRQWGIAEQDAQAVLERLLAERFIDEKRYASAFVRDKIRMSGWGPAKIRSALLAKGVVRDAVNLALSSVDAAADRERLLGRMKRKAASLVGLDNYGKKVKIIRYGLSLGYDYDTVLSVADMICEE